MKTILITGGAGFIGSHTVRACLLKGWQVIVLDNLSNGNINRLPEHSNLKFVEGDILNFTLLKNLIEEVDVILHLAAIASVPQSIAEPLATLQVNTRGFLNILEAVRQTNLQIRIVYASSAAVYGDAPQLPCVEHSINDVCSPYALEKSTNERYAKLYRELFQINALGLRYFNVYGEFQDPHSPYSGVISKFIHQFQKQAAITIYGDGKQARDFIAVEDVANANVLALQSDYQGILNVATGIPETLLNLVEYLNAIDGRQSKINFEEKRTGDIQLSYADTTLCKTHLNFSAKIRLQDGIKLLIAPKNVEEKYA